MNSSSTINTDADDKLPARDRQSHETCSAPSGRFNASAVASSTLGPPVCMIQVEMSPRDKPCSARKLSTSRPRCLRTMLGTSMDKTTLKPSDEMFHPMTSSVSRENDALV